MNRFALLRYSILDACFTSPEGTPRERRQRGKEAALDPGGNTLMFKEDLLDLVNRRLQEAAPGTKAIAMRTLEKDLVDMQRLYGVKIVKHSLHKRAWYSYASSGMSIRKGKLSSSEMARLEGALGVLSKFHDVPGYSWLRSIDGRLRFAFGMLKPAGAPSGLSARSEARWLSDPGALPSFDIWETLLGGLAHGTWLEMAAGGAEQTVRIEAFSDEAGVCIGAGTSYSAARGFEPFRFRLADVTAARTAETVPSAPPEAQDWTYPLLAHAAVAVPTEDSGEAVEMRIWFSAEALASCDHKPFPAEVIGKPEPAAGGLILNYMLVPGPAWSRRLWSFGPGAQVLEPIALRMQLAAGVEQMRAGYAKLFGP